MVPMGKYSLLLALVAVSVMTHDCFSIGQCCAVFLSHLNLDKWTFEARIGTQGVPRYRDTEGVPR